MPKGPITGVVPDFSNYVLGSVPLLSPVPPGISVQALGTFGLHLNDLRGKPAKRQDPVVQELGIPLNALYYQAILDPPTGWEGLCLEVTGTKAEDPASPDAFQWTDMFAQDQPMIILAWRRRVYCKAVPNMYLEVRWRPDTEPMNHMAWPSTIPDKAVKTFMAKARQLLRAVDRRGRRRGPAGFKDAQDFKDTLIRLIQTAHDKRLGTKQETIATLLQPELTSRRGGIESAASVNVHARSTARLIQKHISYTWDDLVKEALQPR